MFHLPMVCSIILVIEADVDQSVCFIPFVCIGFEREPLQTAKYLIDILGCIHPELSGCITILTVHYTP